MYDSSPRPVEGKPIEEVLPSAINATATSAKGESQKESRRAELARTPTHDEPRMAVMRPGSVSDKFAGLPAPLLIAGALALVVLVVLAIVLI